MKGQMTIFDLIDDGAPCRYRFKRYVGQKVRIMIGAYPGRIYTGTVVRILDYFTYVRTKNGIMVGTPYNLSEEER